MSRRIRLLLAGLLVLALSTSLAGCMPSNPLKNTITVTAYFPDSAGLFVGNDVGVLGVPIGKITEIEPAGIEVKVTMEVDGDRAIPADAGAAVVARSVATDRYVELTPVYAGGPKLGDGAEIAREKTVTPVDFDDVLAALNTFATGISGSKEGTKAIQDIINNGEAAFRGNGELFNGTIKSLAEAVTGVSGQRKDLSQTLVSLDILVNEIADNEGTARTFIQQVSRASRMLADERLNFRSALRALDRAVTVVADFAVTNRDQVVDAIGGTSKVFRTMLRKQKQLTEILEVMPLAMQNLTRVVTPDGRAPVRVPPKVILPFGTQIEQLCETLPGPICDLISGTDPTPLVPPGGAR
jgi:phospholipid/cholesterol/gamma-HCH transport system substrate-binding protein